MTSARRRNASVLLLGLGLSSAVAAQSPNLLGDWRLVSMTFVNIDTAEVSRPWGVSPVGQLTYSANGRMIAVLTADPKDRKPAVPGSDKAKDEQAALFLSASAYAGTWSASGSTVTHKVDVAVNASWVGTDQVRYVRLDQDDLTIDTAPITSFVDGKTKYKISLIWRRIK